MSASVSANTRMGPRSQKHPQQTLLQEQTDSAERIKLNTLDLGSRVFSCLQTRVIRPSCKSKRPPSGQQGRTVHRYYVIVLPCVASMVHALHMLLH